MLSTLRIGARTACDVFFYLWMILQGCAHSMEFLLLLEGYRGPFLQVDMCTETFQAHPSKMTSLLPQWGD
jgi:hypothetical protein